MLMRCWKGEIDTPNKETFEDKVYFEHLVLSFNP